MDVTLAVNWLDAHSLIAAFGAAGVIAIIFAETGLLVGVFLPGDSLLVAAGIAAGGGLGGTAELPLVPLLVGCPAAAIAGAQVGYWIGERTGPYLFRKPDARLFRHEYVEKASELLEKFGPARAVFIARFVPIARTFLNPVVGVLGMPKRTFVIVNVIGGVVWTVGLVSLGYGLGKSVEDIDKYLLPAIALIVALSVLPIITEVMRRRRKP